MENPSDSHPPPLGKVYSRLKTIIGPGPTNGGTTFKLRNLISNRIPFAIPSPIKHWLTLSFILLMAIVPPVLVFLDRWLDNESVREILRDMWCKVPFLCRSFLPSYILIASACIVIVIVLVARVGFDLSGVFREDKEDTTSSIPQISPPKRQHIIGTIVVILSAEALLISFIVALVQGRLPGWGFAFFYLTFIAGWIIREFSFHSAVSIFRKAWLPVTLLLYVHLALIGSIAGYYTVKNLLFFTLPVLAAAIIAIVKVKPKITPSLWIVSLALLVYVVYIDAWWFSVIGDEYAFFRWARSIAENQDLFSYNPNLFNGAVIYGSHAYISVLIQALFLKVFGSNNFGWRFSNIYLSALAAGVFYLFFNQFMKKRVAILASLFLTASSYIMSFSKVGYNNLQAYFMLSITMLVTSWAIKSRRTLAYVTLGVCLGLCFYSYPAALYVTPLPFLLLAFYCPPKTRAELGKWAIAGATAFLLIMPLLMQPEYWVSKISGTFFYRPELLQDPSLFVEHMTSNLLYSFFAFLFIPEETHFVVVSYLGPLTSAFFILGTAFLVVNFRKHRFSTFLILSFIYMLLILGVSHDRPYPSTTRMFMLLPWYAVFAAIGLTAVLNKMKSAGLSRTLQIAFSVVVFIMIFGLNFYQAYPLSKVRQAARYQSPQALFIRSAQEIFNKPSNLSSTIVLINTPSTFIANSLLEVFEIYQIPFSPDRMVEIAAVEPAITPDDNELILDEHSVVAIMPWVEEEVADVYEAALADAGKEYCIIFSSIGDPVLRFWRGPVYEGFCRPK
ncbi:MAG: hypothetical protein GTO18_17535 [Anaerolineales bacterium]|nr:hypothetical protein [Anaerolineales bacterium]